MYILQVTIYMYKNELNYGDRMSAEERIGQYKNLYYGYTPHMIALVSIIILSGFLK